MKPKNILASETKLRAIAKRVEDYRIAHGIDVPNPDAETLDAIFEDILEQADQVRMSIQPRLKGRS